MLPAEFVAGLDDLEPEALMQTEQTTGIVEVADDRVVRGDDELVSTDGVVPELDDERASEIQLPVDVELVVVVAVPGVVPPSSMSNSASAP